MAPKFVAAVFTAAVIARHVCLLLGKGGGGAESMAGSVAGYLLAQVKANCHPCVRAALRAYLPDSGC